MQFLGWKVGILELRIINISIKKKHNKYIRDITDLKKYKESLSSV